MLSVCQPQVYALSKTNKQKKKIIEPMTSGEFNLLLFLQTSPSLCIKVCLNIM